MQDSIVTVARRILSTVTTFHNAGVRAVDIPLYGSPEERKEFLTALDYIFAMGLASGRYVHLDGGDIEWSIFELLDESH